METKWQKEETEKNVFNHPRHTFATLRRTFPQHLTSSDFKYESQIKKLNSQLRKYSLSLSVFFYKVQLLDCLTSVVSLVKPITPGIIFYWLEGSNKEMKSHL